MKKTFILAAAFAVVAAPAAHAASWTRVTAEGGSSIEQVALLRTGDNVLHVAWHKGGDLFHTRVAPDGKVGATSPIQTGWAGMSDPALTTDGGGVRVVFGGIRTTDSTDPNVNLNTALSSDGGTSWELLPGSIVEGAQAYGSDASATTLPNGTQLQTWAGTLGTWVHAGLSPASPNFDYMAGVGSYGYNPGIASDSSGNAVLAWYSNATGATGVRTQPVGPTGAPNGSAAVMPGSADVSGGLERMPIVARPKSGGFYVAYGLGYPTANQVRVWRVGSSTAKLIARTENNAEVTVAADPNGRLWVVWSAGSFGSKRVLAARSNPEATEFGAPVDVGVVKNTHSIWSVDASATASSLDILANFGVGTENTSSTYIARINPGLVLKAKRSAINTKFTVTDAGDPVKGAKVKFGSRSGKTNSKGTVTLPGRKGTATATASGYASAKLKLK